MGQKPDETRGAAEGWNEVLAARSGVAAVDCRGIARRRSEWEPVGSHQSGAGAAHGRRLGDPRQIARASLQQHRLRVSGPRRGTMDRLAWGWGTSLARL